VQWRRPARSKTDKHAPMSTLSLLVVALHRVHVVQMRRAVQAEQHSITSGSLASHTVEQIWNLGQSAQACSTQQWCTNVDSYSLHSNAPCPQRADAQSIHRQSSAASLLGRWHRTLGSRSGSLGTLYKMCTPTAEPASKGIAVLQTEALSEARVLNWET